MDSERRHYERLDELRGRKHFSKITINEIVESIEMGMSRNLACRKYGMGKATLSGWMKRYGSIAYQKSQQPPPTKAEKRTAVRSYQDGKKTLDEIKKTYFVRSSSTIRAWIKEINQEDESLIKLEQSVMDTDGTSEGFSDPNEKRLLELALQEAELKIKALNTLIDVAEEQFKISIRKKAGAKQSKE